MGNFGNRVKASSCLGDRRETESLGRRLQSCWSRVIFPSLLMSFTSAIACDVSSMKFVKAERRADSVIGIFGPNIIAA